MRGAPDGLAGIQVGQGIIPAYAGSTLHVIQRIFVREDHPRVCGEHDSPSSRVMIAMGSSPRMRGALTISRWCASGRRIIPAYAGSTHGYLLCGRSCEDHPRVCGEHFYLLFRLGCRLGSSPRMRGAPLRGHLPVQDRRIIPAYAGSTIMRSALMFSSRDHPRVCGEH